MINNGTVVQINDKCKQLDLIKRIGTITKYYEPYTYGREEFYEIKIDNNFYHATENCFDILSGYVGGKIEDKVIVEQDINGVPCKCSVDRGNIHSDFSSTENIINRFYPFEDLKKDINTKQFKEDKGIITSTKEDVINKPSHYNQFKIEPIDVIEDWKLDYCEGNVVKYLARYKYKNKPLEDLKKAEFYLKKLIAKLEK